MRSEGWYLALCCRLSCMSGITCTWYANAANGPKPTDWTQLYLPTYMHTYIHTYTSTHTYVTSQSSAIGSTQHTIHKTSAVVGIVEILCLQSLQVAPQSFDSRCHRLLGMLRFVWRFSVMELPRCWQVVSLWLRPNPRVKN